MDIIIKLILKIFQEVFEKSNQKQRADKARKTQSLQDLLKQMGQAQNPQPILPPVPRPPTPMVGNREVSQAKRISEKPVVLEKQKGVSARKSSSSFDLPGESPMEQLILAQAILSPCLAHKNSGFKDS